MADYKVAGIGLRLLDMDFPRFQKRMKAYEAENIVPDAVVSLQTGDTVEKPEGELVAVTGGFRHCLRTPEGYANYDLSVESDIPFGSLKANRDWSEISLSMRDISYANPEVTYEVRAFAMMANVIANVALFHDAVAVHASSIAVDGQHGLLFSAPSGTGKSTHTGLWQKYYPDRMTYINDDQPLVRFCDGKPMVYGSPWSGKTDINQNISVPLKAIIFLEQSKTNHIRPLEKKEAIGRLLNELRKPVYPELMLKTLDYVDLIIKETPTYLLQCDISKEAVDTVQKALGL